MTENFVSIDWGGTHLNGVIFNSIDKALKKKFLKEFELPSSNLKLISDKNLEEICKNIIKIVKQYVDSKIILLIGAAGVSNDKTADRLINSFKQLSDSFEKIEIYPDFLCNHAAYLNGKDGILSINGTGSILFGVNGKKQIRHGGWGYIFDETPSGSYFGKKYIEAVLSGLDGNKSFEYYVNDFKNNNNFIEREEILNRIYMASSPQNYLGNYSKYLIKAYEANEVYAVETINKSIDRLSKSILDLATYLDLKRVRFCGSGGLWKNWKALKNMLNVSCEKLGVQLIWEENGIPLNLGPFLCYKSKS